MTDGLHIELLGTPAVRHGPDTRRIAGLQRALLAVLALHAPAPVSADRLADVIWGDKPPDDPANALQQRISALRKEVDPDRRGGVLVPVGGGYALRVTDDQIDARRFEALATEGRTLLAAGDAAGAHQRLSDALALWGGPALDGFADAEWAIADVQRLAELYLTATEDELDAALNLGAGVELVGRLTELVTDHPLRERLCGQLMQALYRAGRQAEALARYDQMRRRLADELGVDPGPGLQAIYRRVLDQDPALEATTAVPATGVTPAEAPGRRDGNLPARTGAVIGREAALTQVERLLSHGRLITLTGPGGAGKTTVGLEAARRHDVPADGVWLVELAPVNTPEAVVAAVAAVLGVAAGGLGAPQVDVDTVAGTVANRELLLVLDNCEHVLDAVAPLAERLLAQAPGLRLLATSREPLGVTGELVWSVPPLGVPDMTATSVDVVVGAPAVQLLVERARAVDPTFSLSDQTAVAATTVVRRLDGIPLAIELAAARLRVLSLVELAEGLDDRFGLLATRSRTAPSRQRTLRAALDWSWDLLDERSRAAWAALSVPADRFDRNVAAAMLQAAGTDDQTVDVLAELVDRSLLAPDTTVTPTRYRMLETIREYGRDRLVELGLAEAVNDRHSALVEAALDAAHTATDPAQFGVDLDTLTAWLPDARTVMNRAVAAGDRNTVRRIAGRLGWLWLLRGLAREGARWLDAGFGVGKPEADVPDAKDLDPEAALWASALRVGGRTADAEIWSARAMSAARTPADRVVAGVFAAVHHAHAGRIDDCAAQLAACEPDAREIGGWPLGFLRLIGAQIGRLTGQPHQAGEQAAEALQLLTDGGVNWARVNAIDIVIDDLHARGDYTRARELAEDGLTLCQQEQLPELEARMLLQLAEALHELGEVEAARPHLDRAIELAATAGGGPGLGFALLMAGSITRRRGELGTACHQLQQALELLGGSDTAYGPIWARTELAHTAALAGDNTMAMTASSEALEMAAGLGQPDLLARALEARADASLASGGNEAAIALLAAAHVLRRQPGAAPLPPPLQRDLDRLTNQLRDQLGALFDRYWAERVENAEGALEEMVGELVATHSTSVSSRNVEGHLVHDSSIAAAPVTDL